MKEYAESIEPLIKYYFGKLKSDHILRLSPGRCIVSNAGVYVSSVIDNKGKWLFIDGSINHVPENIFFASRRIVSVKQGNYDTNYLVAGRTLNTGDVLSMKQALPKMAIGGSYHDIGLRGLHNIKDEPIHDIAASCLHGHTRKKKSKNKTRRMLRRHTKTHDRRKEVR